MIPQYGKLNRIYAEITSGKGFFFEKQKFISDFYNRYKDTQAFEASLVKLMLEVDAERYSLLLNSLKQEITSNVSMYNASQTLFNNLDIEYVCRQYADRFDWSINGQMSVTKECNKELLEANGALEAVGFRVHDRQEEDLLERRYERCKLEYEQQKAKLDELYELKKQATEEVLQCLKNRFKDISELGSSLLSILEKYVADQKKKEEGKADVPASEPMPTNQPAYFSMKLASAIREICNGEQFEDIPEMDFYANLNLHPCKVRLKMRAREKARVCYLIFLMSETLPKQDREMWKEGIMRLLEISKDYYKSKYKEPVSDFPSDTNQKFANEMKALFSR